MRRPYDWAWQQFRLGILDRDHHTCQIQLPGCTTTATHVDHIVPLSEGGARLDPANTRAACEHCNLSRNGTRGPLLAAALNAVTNPPPVATGTPSRDW